MNHIKSEKNDGRSNLSKSPASITFRCDLASKKVIEARAIAFGYPNISGYLRDAGLGVLPELEGT